MEGHELRVGVLGASPELVEVCTDALRGLCAVEPIELPGREGAGASPSVPVVLVAFGRLLQSGIALLGTIRSELHGPRILVLCSHADAEFAVELVPEDVDAVARVPIEPAALWEQVDRYLVSGSERPPDSIPPSRPLGRVAVPAPGERRRGFRASVVEAELVAQVELRAPGGGALKLAVENLSVCNEDWPGGMLLFGRLAVAELAALSGLAAGDTLEAALALPDGAEPIALRTRVVVPARRRLAGDHAIAVQYLLRERADEDRIGRFWLECQRRSRRPPESW